MQEGRLTVFVPAFSLGVLFLGEVLGFFLGVEEGEESVSDKGGDDSALTLRSRSESSVGSIFESAAIRFGMVFEL